MVSTIHRYVANRLSEMGETAMSPSSSTDMTDVDMASIAEDELSEKFSVQGIATGKTSGKTKIVRTFGFFEPFSVVYGNRFKYNVA